MPNAPLPKPAAPVTINPNGTQKTPAASPSAPPAPSVPAAQPATSPPLVPQAPVIGGRQAPPPTTRQPQAPPLTQNPPSSAPTAPPLTPPASTGSQSVPGRGAGQSMAQSSQAPTSGQVPPASRPNPQAQQPPKTLSALESMASNTLPSGATAASPKLPPGAAGGPPPGPGVTTTATPSGGSSGNVDLAAPKKSALRFLPLIIGIIALLGVIGFAAMRFMGGGTSVPVSDSGQGNQGGDPAPVPAGQQVSLEYWGLWEPSDVMDDVIADYETQNPGVSINYSKQSHQDYRERLRNALVSGNGPDLFRYHATWVSMLHEELSPMPSAVMTANEFSSTFYPVALSQLQNRSKQIVGIPLMYEGLALYYNTEIFSTAVVDPPTTWSELRNLANQLTVRSGSTIQRAGIAMGNASNTEHFSDILAVLLLQNGAQLEQPNSPATRDALQFYTLFARSDRVWDDAQPLSSVAFARGDVAMMFAPSWRAHEVKTMNPNLQFKVVPLPQLTDNRITWANYWAEGVSSFSDNKEESWRFLKYLSSADVQKKLHASQGQVRPFGEIYSRKDLADELAADPYMGAYVRDAQYAQGWYMSSSTHDDGANDQIVGYYADAISAMLQGESVDDVMPTLELGVNQVLRQYGIQEQQ